MVLAIAALRALPTHPMTPRTGASNGRIQVQRCGPRPSEAQATVADGGAVGTAVPLCGSGSGLRQHARSPGPTAVRAPEVERSAQALLTTVAQVRALGRKVVWFAPARR